MSSQKYIIGLAFLVAALLTINTVPTSGAVDSYVAAENNSHHLIVGLRTAGDKLVLKENIVKNSSWLKIVTTEKIFFVSDSRERITQLRALDQKTNGNGAYASILQGGPGSNNVTLRFKSQRSHGINFVVEIYARY